MRSWHERGRTAEARHSAQLSRVQQTLEELRASTTLESSARKEVEARAVELAEAKKQSEAAAELEKRQLQKQYDDKLKAEAAERKAWESRFRDREIEASLRAAAQEHEAFSPDQIVTLLRNQVEATQVRDARGQLTADFEIKVKWQDTDPATGEPVTVLLPPAAVVKRMRDNPQKHGNLFKSGVLGGLGSSSAPSSAGREIGFEVSHGGSVPGNSCEES